MYGICCSSEKNSSFFENCSFRALFRQNGQSRAPVKIKFNFFLEITKEDQKLSDTFQNILSFEWVMKDFSVLFDISLPSEMYHLKQAEISQKWHQYPEWKHISLICKKHLKAYLML